MDYALSKTRAYSICHLSEFILCTVNESKTFHCSYAPLFYCCLVFIIRSETTIQFSHSTTVLATQEYDDSLAVCWHGGTLQVA